jgi:hypothetical protein
VAAPIPPAAAPLLALPPARFGAARDALARRLAEGHDPAAGAVRKVRRPVGLAWVLNRLARDHPREVEALLEAGDAVRSRTRAALAGRAAPDLRAADERLHAAARTLRLAAEAVVRDEAARVAPSALARLELLLRLAASGDRALRDAFRGGLLEREPEAGDAGLAAFGALPAGGRRGEASRHREAGSRPEAATPVRSPAHADAPGEGRRQARADARREAAEARARARKEDARRRAVATAEREAARARREAERAGARAAEARRRSDAAEREAAEARARAERAEAELKGLRREPPAGA